MSDSTDDQVDGVVDVYEMLMAVTRSLVDHREEIKIIVVPQNNSVLFRVQLNQKDIGKMIGASGRMSRSIRIILNACCMKYRQKYHLDIVDGSSQPSTGLVT
jgi:hypothetical protein